MGKAVLLVVPPMFVGCGPNQNYEVIETHERDVPNCYGPGTHSEPEYVLVVHGRHKIYAGSTPEQHPPDLFVRNVFMLPHHYIATQVNASCLLDFL